ncbi:ECF sigma factor [Roseimaritima multifibrata]|uniref:ECF sigma factor n=1 Tax=Roseimaritima multifibrata TaxID=1930274 RepID=A0A517MNN9_9BACT|nr:ECF-type sigma factor [Roseimaritima multifibrata]QDS96492.1 ECF sigma factor [Roseimaritima multifibrata]
MGEVTELLCKLRLGDAGASEGLLRSVYKELRSIAELQFADEYCERTLQPTALVNEAYLRLVSGGRLQKFDSRGHFFAAAAEAMRRILIDAARARGSQKRGGHYRRVELGELADESRHATDLLLDLDDGLQRLVAVDNDSANLVKLRVFAGLSITEAGELLGMSRSTAYKNWQFARTWFAVRWEK